MVRISIVNAKSLAKPRCNGGFAGFTLVEMIGVMIIVATLAVMVLPRFADHSFDTRVFLDQTLAMLRHAQKIAIAQNRSVFVHLRGGGTLKSIAFCFDAACNDHVVAPTGNNSGSANTLAECGGAANATWFCEGLPSGVTSTAAPIVFYFNALGQPFNAGDTQPASNFTSQLNIPLTGGSFSGQIDIDPETGYVHWHVDP